MVIIITEADYDSFLTLSMKELLQKKYINSILKDKLYKYVSGPLLVFHTFISVIVMFILNMNPIQSLLQYGISTLTVSKYFPSHPTTSACNLVVGAYNYDIALAAISSTIIYLLVIPFFYILGMIVTPKKANVSIDVLDDVLRVEDENENLEKEQNFKFSDAPRKLKLVAAKFLNRTSKDKNSSKEGDHRLSVQHSVSFDDESSIRHYAMSSLKMSSKIVSVDVLLLSIMNTWISVLRSSLLKQTEIISIINDDSINSSMKTANDKLLDISSSSSFSNICFSNFERSEKETDKWTTYLDNKVEKYSSLCLGNTTTTNTTTTTTTINITSTTTKTLSIVKR